MKTVIYHEATGSIQPETVVCLNIVTVGHQQRRENGGLSSTSGAFLSASGALTSEAMRNMLFMTPKRRPDKVGTQKNRGRS